MSSLTPLRTETPPNLSAPGISPTSSDESLEGLQSQYRSRWGTLEKSPHGDALQDELVKCKDLIEQLLDPRNFSDKRPRIDHALKLLDLARGKSDQNALFKDLEIKALRLTTDPKLASRLDEALKGKSAIDAINALRDAKLIQPTLEKNAEHPLACDSKQPEAPGDILEYTKHQNNLVKVLGTGIRFYEHASHFFNRGADQPAHLYASNHRGLFASEKSGNKFFDSTTCRASSQYFSEKVTSIACLEGNHLALTTENLLLIMCYNFQQVVSHKIEACDQHQLLSLPGNRLACTSNQTIAIFDLKKMRTLGVSLKGHTRTVTSIILIAKKYLISADTSRQLIVWDLSTLRLFRSLDSASPIHTLVALAEERFASGSENHVTVWKWVAGNIQKDFDLATKFRVRSLAALPIDRLAAGTDNEVILWNLQQKSEISRIQDLPRIYSLTSTHDNDLIIDTTQDSVFLKQSWDSRQILLLERMHQLYIDNNQKERATKLAMVLIGEYKNLKNWKAIVALVEKHQNCEDQELLFNLLEAYEQTNELLAAALTCQKLSRLLPWSTPTIVKTTELISKVLSTIAQTAKAPTATLTSSLSLAAAAAAPPPPEPLSSASSSPLSSSTSTQPPPPTQLVRSSSLPAPNGPEPSSVPPILFPPAQLSSSTPTLPNVSSSPAANAETPKNIAFQFKGSERTVVAPKTTLSSPAALNADSSVNSYLPGVTEIRTGTPPQENRPSDIADLPIHPQTNERLSQEKLQEFHRLYSYSKSTLNEAAKKYTLKDSRTFVQKLIEQGFFDYALFFIKHLHRNLHVSDLKDLQRRALQLTSNQRYAGRLLKYVKKSDDVTFLKNAKLACPKWECLRTLEMGPSLPACIVSLAQQRLAVAERETIKIWDVSSNTEIGTLRLHNKTVVSLCQLPNNRLASLDADGYLDIWDLSTNQLLREIKTTPFDGYQFLTTLPFNRIGVGKINTSAYNLTLFDLNSYQEVDKQPVFSRVTSLLPLSRQRYVHGRSSGIITISNALDGTQVSQFQAHNSAVHCLISLPLNRYASSSDQEIKIWEDEKHQKTLTGHNDFVTKLISLSGNRLASGSKDGTVIIWNLDTFKPIYRIFINKGPILNLASFPDGKLIIDSQNGPLEVWEPNRENSESREILEYLHEHLPKEDLEGRMGVLLELIEYYKKEQQWEKIIALIDQYPETTGMHLLLEKRECYKRLGRLSDAINVNLALIKAHPYEDNFQLETNRLLLMRVRPDIWTFDSK